MFLLDTEVISRGFLLGAPEIVVQRSSQTWQHVYRPWGAKHSLGWLPWLCVANSIFSHHAAKSVWL